MADASLQVADIQASFGAIGSSLQVSDIVATFGPAGSRVQVADIEATFSSFGSRVQVADIEATFAVLAALQARSNPGQTVYPFSDVLVDGSASTGAIVDATWAQVPNGAPTIDILPTSELLFTYRPPPARAAYSLVFELTLNNGSQTSTVRRTDSVMPAQLWTGAGAPLPLFSLVNVPIPAAVEPVTGVPTSLTASVGSSVTLTMTAGDPDGFVTGFWWRPTAWPAPAFAPILLTPDQPTTDTLPFTVPGTYVFEATAGGSCGLTSAPKTTTVTVT